jgi:hypothetical protein
MRDPRALLDAILEWHAVLRDEVVAATGRQSLAAMAAVDRDDAGDTIYAIDVVAEEVVARFADTLARQWSFVLVAEGLPGGRRVFPSGADEHAVDCWIIVDPVDGTRGLMYQKRSAWILTAVAPNRGPGTSLRDVELAVQTEIPLLKQHLCDQLWARRGDGAHGRRYNRLTGDTEPLHLRPSAAPTIAHGFATVVRFFPGARDELAWLVLISLALGKYTLKKNVMFYCRVLLLLPSPIQPALPQSDQGRSITRFQIAHSPYFQGTWLWPVVLPPELSPYPPYEYCKC